MMYMDAGALGGLRRRRRCAPRITTTLGGVGRRVVCISGDVLRLHVFARTSSGCSSHQLEENSWQDVHDTYLGPAGNKQILENHR